MDNVWIALAIVAGIIFMAALGRRAWTLRPQPGMSGLPTSPLEKLGWVGIAVTLTVGAGLTLIVFTQGASFFEDNGAARGVFWLLLMGAIGVWSAAWRIIKRRSGGAVVDERDRAILARSLSVESIVVLLSLVTWTVALTETFGDEGAVPLAYLQLIFWSTLIIGAFGRSLGIVLGYRREVTVDA